MKIFVVCHKDIIRPQIDGYVTIGVGALANDENAKVQYRDNQGMNISDKNPYYSELTALYWIWKNCADDIVGLVHYRRYFSWNRMFKIVLTEKKIRKILQTSDIIVPKARVMDVTRKDPDLTIWNHFKKWHNIQDLIETRNIIEKQCSDYLESFDKVGQKKTIWPYNMLICKKSVLDAYRERLFPILEDLEKRVDISDYDNYQRRLFGFISERLFNVWVTKNNYRYVEKSILNTAEPRNKVFVKMSKIDKE